MKIIEPSYTILSDATSQEGILAQLEERIRLCYKSEGKIQEGTAATFVQGIIKSGHAPALEMAHITLSISTHKLHDTLDLGKFVMCSRYQGTAYFSGTVRAFREVWNDLPSCFAVRLVLDFPELFEDLPKRAALVVLVNEVSSDRTYPEGGPDYVYHKYQAVQIICNRAVTHEIVRHRPASYLQESQRYCRYDKDQFGNEVTFIKPMFFEEGTHEYSMWLYAMKQTEEVYLKLLKTSSPQAARTVLPNSCKTEIIVYTSLFHWKHIFKLRTSGAAEPSMREIMVPMQDEFRRMYPTCGF